MLVADYAQNRVPTRTSSLPQELEKRDKQKLSIKIGYICLLLLGIFLLGQPIPDWHSEETWPFPWNYLHKLIPSWYGWQQGEEFW